ncbi:MAG: response regulator [Caldimonas sp.]
MPTSVFAGYAVAIAAVFVTAWLSYASLQERSKSTERITRIYEVLGRVQGLLSSLQDAETTQRGFLLTGDEAYLVPYGAAKVAVPKEIEGLRPLVAMNPDQRERLAAIARASAAKLAELDQTIALRRGGNADAARAFVQSDLGNATMAGLRGLVAAMEREEGLALGARQREWQDAASFSFLITGAGSALLVVLIAFAAWSTSRSHRERETIGWQRLGLANLAVAMQGDQRLEALGDRVLAFLSTFVDAQVAALYVAEGGGRFRRVAGYAHDAATRPGGDDVLQAGQGLIGQAAKDGQALHVRDVPAGYLEVSSSLGRASPRELLIAPAQFEGVVQAVFELGFLREVGAAERELLDRMSESIGAAIRAAKDHGRLEELLAETQTQAEELQAQQEELRVSNEELEEQGRALKETQGSLEEQQAELEASNAQLEEHGRLLEDQKEALTSAQVKLNDRAFELERASRYKSEFLANMSHELRTPLNSTLILSRLLADNKDGNLSDEQVRFASTIESAGNDLLVLINDVLDLSKIEAGKAEVEIGSVSLARTFESLTKTFLPIAGDKGLAFSASLEPGAPVRIETDGQRLGQILKNLLSNAIKFTDRGEVSLRAAAGAAETVMFTVRDSGIGISPDHHALVFEAFRQADGSTHRKYGGTGLGLSISRDLAHLLGGEIALQSRPGEGSVFTLTLPLVCVGAAETPIDERAAPTAAPAARAVSPPVRPTPPPAPARAVASPPRSATAVDDDRHRLTPGARLILVIEDDVRFAAILRDLAHEMGFLCVVTHTANDGVAAALAHRPSAVLLDMNLPDYSGLGVLDQLKRNPATRHIPVHVASVADYSHEALALGAVGYALKPVKREQLVDALKLLETKFLQGLRRLLIVEDDETQRLAMKQLLGTAGVEITLAGDAAEALAQLKATTFDCMVMDLHLPDLTGYQLLEQMAAADDLAFPPVIVYTGQALTRDEEQALGRFSRSIIVKGAHSPERLLDEVTLFLHQVETELPPASQRLLKKARNRETLFEGRRILVVEDDVRNVFALTSVLEPRGVQVQIARNGREALEALEQSTKGDPIDLVLMDIMMPEMDGLTAMREIRKRPQWKKLPVIALTAKAMKDDQDRCLDAGANDYIAKPLDVEKLLSLVRVWLPARA